MVFCSYLRVGPNIFILSTKYVDEALWLDFHSGEVMLVRIPKKSSIVSGLKVKACCCIVFVLFFFFSFLLVEQGNWVEFSESCVHKLTKSLYFLYSVVPLLSAVSHFSQANSSIEKKLQCSAWWKGGSCQSRGKGSRDLCLLNRPLINPSYFGALFISLHLYGYPVSTVPHPVVLEEGVIFLCQFGWSSAFSTVGLGLSVPRSAKLVDSIPFPFCSPSLWVMPF